MWKEFLLRPLLPTQKLNVVNQKNVGLPITLAEFHQITVLDRVDEVVNKQLTGDVDHLHVLPFRPDELADGLHEMGLAETDAAVNKEGIIRTRRRLRDSETGCVRDFIVRSDDERFERVPRVESRNSCDLAACRSEAPATLLSIWPNVPQMFARQPPTER